MEITPINLDITERLRDHEFAVEYVAAVEERLKSVEHALVRMVETAYADDATQSTIGG